MVAHFLEDRTHAQIAQSLGVSRQTVTYRISKGIELVRKNLRRKGVPVQVTAIAAALTASRAQAIPVGLSAALGRVAVSGVGAARTVGATASTALSMTGGILVAKNVILLTTAFLVLIATIYATIYVLHTARLSSAQKPLASSAAALAVLDAHSEAVMSSKHEPATNGTPDQSQEGTPFPALELSKEAGIEGTLVDRAKHPLVGWRVNAVELLESGQAKRVFKASERTDTSGHFAFGGLPGGTFLLVGRSSEHFIRAQDQQTTIRLATGEHRRDIVVVVNDGQTISGFAIDTSGNPIQGVEIHADLELTEARIGLEGRAELDGWVGISSDTTAEDGSFTLTGLEDALYSISVDDEKFEPADVSEVTPGSSDLRIELTPARTRLRGRVISARTGKPIEDFQLGDVLSAFDAWEPGFVVAPFAPMHDSNGSFDRVVTTLHGAATLLVQAKGYQPAAKAVTGSKAGTEKEVIITLEDGRKLKVRVLDSKNKPVAGASVYVGPPLNPHYPRYAGCSLGTTDAAGIFELTTLSNQDTMVSAFMDGRVPASALIPNPASSGAVVDIHLPDEGGTIEGIVTRGGLGLRNAELQLTPGSDQWPGLPYSARTGDDGRYRLTGIPECFTSLSCVDEQVDTTDHAVTQLWSFRSVAPRPGRTITLDFDMTPGNASLEGKVSDSGVPVPWCNIRVTVDHGAGESLTYRVDSHNDGTFVLHGMPPGAASLKIGFPEGQIQRIGSSHHTKGRRNHPS